MNWGSFGRMVLALALAGTMLASCGRKDDLDAPGAGPVVKRADGTTAKQDVEDRPFLLDPLL